MTYLSADHFSVKLELSSIPTGFNPELVGQLITIDLEYDPPWASIFGSKKNGATIEQFRKGVSLLLSALADQKTHEFFNIGNGLQLENEVNSF